MDEIYGCSPGSLAHNYKSPRECNHRPSNIPGANVLKQKRLTWPVSACKCCMFTSDNGVRGRSVFQATALPARADVLHHKYKYRLLCKCFTWRCVPPLLAHTFRHTDCSDPSWLGADDAGGGTLPSLDASVQQVLWHLQTSNSSHSHPTTFHIPDLLHSCHLPSMQDVIMLESSC